VDPGFDWDEWDNPEDGAKEKGITDTAMANIFDNERMQLSTSDAVTALIKLTGLKKSACYKALDLKGRFKHHLQYNSKNKILTWKM
jgi:hypothetical protein